MCDALPLILMKSDQVCINVYLLQVRILSLDPEDIMGVLAVQAVPNVPDSLLLIDSTAADISGKGDDAAGAGGLFLNIGALLKQPQWLVVLI